MKIHEEVGKLVLVSFIVSIAIVVLCWMCCDIIVINIIASLLAVYFQIFVTLFFRVPNRIVITNPNVVLSPGDGNVVAIEEVDAVEYFNDRRIRVSVFMTFFNIHINWYPISGIIKYVSYYPGEKQFAMYAKSSEKNEHSTIVIENNKGKEIMFRQIAGIFARRIICNAKEGDLCTQGAEVGLIKLGSRVDIFLPLDAKLLVQKGDLVRGQLTRIAEI